MAVVNPAIEFMTGVPVVVWRGANAGDTFAPFVLTKQHGFVGSIQFGGTTLTGATIELQQSNDGVSYFQAKDPSGVDIEVVAAGGIFELSLGVVYVKPNFAVSGSAAGVNVFLALRG